jgi:hypothetical protein
LFSDEPTLAERFDKEQLIDELSKRDARAYRLWHVGNNRK